jgi:CRP-like cAMP-binding protein
MSARRPVQSNAILATLPHTALSALETRLAIVSFDPGSIMQEIEEPMECVYFPTEGVASLQIVMKDGRAVDTAMVGRNSVLNPMAAFDARKSSVRCVALTKLVAFKVMAVELRRAARLENAIVKACIDYNDALLARTILTVISNCSSSIDSRFTTCLLNASHLLASDTIPFAQEKLANLLAVRRASVTEAACKLRDAGLIRYSRGVITILDREGLQKMSGHLVSP